MNPATAAGGVSRRMPPRDGPGRLKNETPGRLANLAPALRREGLVMLRQHIPWAAAFVVTSWVLFLAWLPEEYRAYTAAAAIWVDLAIFGFYFMGGLLFLERDEGALAALATSPIHPATLLAAKTIVLTVVAVVASVAVALLVHGPDLNWLVLIVGVVLTSAQFLPVGFAAAARFRSFSDFLIPSVVLVTVLQLPALWYFGLIDAPGVELFPSYATLLIIAAAFEPMPLGQWAYALSMGLTGVAVAWWLGVRGASRIMTVQVKAWGVSGGAGRAQPGGDAPVGMTDSGGARALMTSSPGTDVGDGPRADVGVRPRAEALRRLEPQGARRGRWTAIAGGMAALIATGFRHISREPMMLFMLGYPPVIIVITKWLIDVATDRFEAVVPVAEYVPLVFVLAALLPVPNLFGAATGLLILDERDEGSLRSVRVAPLPGWAYVIARAAVPMAMAVVVSYAALYYLDLVAVPPARLAGPVLVAALEAPLTALLLGAVARNKVEGLALMKGMGFLFLAPLAAYFVAGPWQWLLGVAPTFWPAKAMWQVIAGEPAWATLIVGAAYHLVLIRLLLRRLERQV